MNIDQILGKILGGKHSREEMSALDDWQKEAEENIKALEEIKKLAKFSESMKGYQDFKADEGWASFESAIEGEGTSAPSEEITPSSDTPQEAPEHTKVFTIKNFTKIAAVLAVVFGCLFVIKNGVGTIGGEMTEYVSNDEQMDIDLKDGTDVLLDSSSSLEILADRSVSLNGRAYFDVAKSQGDNFTITLPVGEVTVLGTEFSIDANAESTEVYIYEGKVSFKLDDRPAVALVAGDYIMVKDNDISKVQKDDDNMISWKNKKLVFRDNNLVEVIEALSRHFKKDIIIENKENIEKCGVTNTFENATLDEILNEFNTIYGIRYEIRAEKVYIVSSNC